jgi:small-conductance mechanosensitive channel
VRSPLTVGEHLARGELRDVVSILDSWGFTVANYHVSVWTGLLVIIVIVGVFVFGKLLTRIARWSLGKVTRLDSTQKLLADKLIGIAIWAFAILVGIDILGIDLTALTIFSGAFGLAVGFGLQKTFGNMLAGIILLMDRSIKPGDVIAVSDPTGRESFGQIRRIGIRAISVVTRDRKEYLIPNENLMVNQVVNWSYSSREVRVKAPVGVAYGTDLELAEKLLLEAAVGAPRVLSQPAPNVRLMAFGANAIEFEIRFWITDPEEGVSGARSEVLKRVWHLFKEHSIELPFPQLDLYLRDSKAFQQLAAAIAHRDAGSDEA